MSASDITASIKRNIIRFENTDTSHPKGTFTQDISYRQSLLTQTKACCPSVSTPEDVSYDIFVIMGQSNAVGQGSTGLLDTTVVPGVMQLGRQGSDLNQIIPAIDSLQHGANYINGGRHNTGVGFGVKFAKTYNSITGRNVLLVPAAKSGSAIGVWDKTALVSSQRSFQPVSGPDVNDAQNRIIDNPFQDVNVYTEALTRTLTAFRKNSNNRIRGILWHQGEGNISNTSTSNYGTSLRSFIANFRADLFANGVTNALYVPWMLGEFVPEFMRRNESGTGARANSKALLRDVIKVVASDPNNAWVTSQAISVADPELNPNSFALTDNSTIHFDSESLIRYGVRYYNEYNRLITGSISVVNSISITRTGLSTLRVVFTQTSGLLTKFILDYYTSGVLVGSIPLDINTNNYTLSNINASLTYLVNITPYYENTKGITAYTSYPITDTTVSDLNMQIVSRDNSTISDQIGSRAITVVPNSGSILTSINTDHNNVSRLMYIFNGGHLTVGGDVPAGSYSKSLWIKFSTSQLPPITGVTFNVTGLFTTMLNLTGTGDTWKEIVQIQAANSPGHGYLQLSGEPVSGGQNYSAVSIAPPLFGTLSAPYLRPDNWLHIVVTWNNTTKNRVVYLNNIAVSNITYSPFTVTAASGNSTVQTYICANNFLSSNGQTVTVTGLSPAGFNVTNAVVVTASSTQFTVSGTTSGSSTGTGTAAGALFNGSNAGYLAPARTSDSIRLGGTGTNTSVLYGWMNDIRYYTKPLTAAEVNRIYIFNE